MRNVCIYYGHNFNGGLCRVFANTVNDVAVSFTVDNDYKTVAIFDNDRQAIDLLRSLTVS